MLFSAQSSEAFAQIPVVKPSLFVIPIMLMILIEEFFVKITIGLTKESF